MNDYSHIKAWYGQPNRLLFLLMFVLGGLQIHYIQRDRTPLGWDESFHALLALETYDRITGHGTTGTSVLDVSAYYPPLVYLLAIPGIALIGRTIDGLLTVQVWMLLLAVGAIYAVGKRVGGSWVGLLAAWFLATAPMVFGASRTFLLDVPLLTMVVMALWLLIVFFESPRPQWAVLFGLMTGAVMLTKWTAFLFLLGPLLALLHERAHGKPLPHPLVPVLNALRGFRHLWKNHRGLLLGLATALMAAFIVCAPWYLRYYDYVLQAFAADPVAKTIFARPGTAESLNLLQRLGFYISALGGNQLHLLPALIVLFGAVWNPRSATSLRVAMLYGWFLAWAVFTWIPLKDPRFMLPALPMLLAAGADGLFHITSRYQRRLVMAAVIGLGILQWGMTSYRWFTDWNVMWQTPIGPVTVWGPGWHCNAIHLDERWPQADIVQTIEARRNGHESLRIVVLSNAIYFHQSSLQLQANLQQYPLQFVWIIHERDRTGQSLEEIAANAEWVVAKTGDIGPPFAAPGVAELAARVLDPHDPLGARFHPIMELPLPDGSRGTLLQRTE